VIGACVQCLESSECDDGIACNGIETCANGSCVSGTTTCKSLDHCVLANDTCLTCIKDAECNNSIFCDGNETCNKGTCASGVSPCKNITYCNFETGNCAPCLDDLDCQDKLFCNGHEICTANYTCIDGPLPCGDLLCDETGKGCIKTDGFIATPAGKAVVGSSSVAGAAFFAFGILAIRRCKKLEIKKKPTNKDGTAPLQMGESFHTISDEYAKRNVEYFDRIGANSHTASTNTLSSYNTVNST